MLDVSQLRTGDTYTVFDQTWRWVAADGVTRGHWDATDGSRVEVYPPSEGITNWMVTFPKGSKEALAQFGEEDRETALRYAAKVRVRMAN